MDPQLRRNFRRWNRSRARYEKEYRKYQFKELKKRFEEDANTFLNRIAYDSSDGSALLVALKKQDPDVLTKLNGWFAKAHAQQVSFNLANPQDGDDVPDVPDKSTYPVRTGGDDIDK